jgi:release factor glutamine methyltransferase
MTGAVPFRLGALVIHVRQTLARAGKPEAALDARLLVEHFTGTSRTDAITDPQRAVPPEAAKAVLAALARRIAGEPVHRIIGAREFYGMRLTLSPGTLEPRPDTEALVDLALPFVRAAADRHGTCRILDLGTGTGAIALALLSQEPRSQAVGADISDDALATAAINADMTGNTGRFQAVRSHWYSEIEGRFHIIVSNPPYITSNDILSLEREVRDHDPLAALDGGPDGLAAYRVIAAGAAQHLEEGGTAAVEIGHDQSEAVAAIFEAAGFRSAGSARDLAGVVRALAFSR